MPKAHTIQEFLEYYKFEDEPEMLPPRFYKKYKFYENIIEKVEENILKKGLPIHSAFQREGVHQQTYYKWKQAFEKEIEDGKTDTPLIRLFGTAQIADAMLEGDLSECAINFAKEGDSKLLRWLLENRFGYKKSTKTELELSTKDDAPVKFEFVDMTPVDNDEE